MGMATTPASNGIGPSPLLSPPQDNGWLPRERVLVLALLAATVLALYLCWLLALPFVPALTWALTFAIVARPLHRWLERKIANRDVVAGVAVVIVALVLIVPGLLVAQYLLNQAAANVDRIEAEVSNGNWQERLKSMPMLGSWLAWLEQRINLEEEAANLLGRATADLAPFVTGSLTAIVQLLIMLFALYYAFRDHHAAQAALRGLMPLTEAETNRLFRRVADTIHATIFGTVIVALLQGFLGGLAFWWLGLPAPVLWGAIMAILSIIPWLGAFVVWAPAAAVLAFQDQWGSALFLTVWGVVVVGLSDNLLYPIIVGDKMRLHTLPTFIAILGGLAVFGTAGLVLGPVVLAVTVALLDVWRQRTAAGQSAEKAVEPPKIELPPSAQPDESPIASSAAVS